MQPLSGTIVVELGTFITGPYAGMLLGDLGADVIKVEQPQSGDPFRNYQGRMYSPQFQAYNKNKRSITLDIKSARGRELLAKLTKRADVIIENFRPDVLEKLGFGWDRLRAINSRLIYCSITGFGAEGPYVDRPCYDTVAQALSGYLSQFVDPKAPRIAGPAVADAISGMFAAYGVLGGLIERSKTGRGKRVEVAMLDALIAFAAEPFAAFFSTGKAPGPYSRPSVSQSYVMTCADGKLLALHLASPEKFWNGLLNCIGRTDLSSDSRFNSREGRMLNFDELTLQLQKSFALQPRSYWLDTLPLHDVPHAPVANLDEVQSNPQVQHRNVFINVEHASEGGGTAIRPPVSYDGSTVHSVRAPPTLGEHTEEILRELGLLPHEVENLRRDKVV